jgi:hypothetical protein
MLLFDRMFSLKDVLAAKCVSSYDSLVGSVLTGRPANCSWCSISLVALFILSEQKEPSRHTSDSFSGMAICAAFVVSLEVNFESFVLDQ